MNKVDLIWLISISLIVYISIFIVCLYNGINLCKSNNALGILVLIIPLNIIGLILGICLIYNAKHGKYNYWIKEKEEWNKVLNNEKTLEDYVKEKKTC